MQIKKIDLVEYLVLLIFCIPGTLNFFPLTGKMITLGKQIGLIYVVLYTIQAILRKEYHESPMKYVYLYLGWLFITSVLHGNNLRTVFSTLYPLYAASFLGYRAFKRDKRVFLSFFSSLFGVYMILNFITFLNGNMYTEMSGWGERDIFFLGITTSCQYLAFIAFALIITKDKVLSPNGRVGIFSILSIASAIAFFVGVWNSSGVLCTILYFGLVLFVKNWNHRLIKKFAVISILVVVAMTYLIVFQNIQERFAWLIVDFLGEELTLNGRIPIWNSLLKTMDASDYLIGKGMGVVRAFVLHNGNITSSAHNQYLDILYNGGILALLLFIKMCIHAVRRYMQQEWGDILPWGMLALIILLLSGISEVSCNTVYFYLFLVWMNGGGYGGNKDEHIKATI